MHTCGFLFPTAHLLIVGANWEEAEKSRQATKSGIAILSALLKTVGVQVLFLLSWAMGEDAVCKQPPPWGSSGWLIRCGSFFKITFKTKLMAVCPHPPLLHPLPYLNAQNWGQQKPRKPAGPNTWKLAGDSLLHFEKWEWGRWGFLPVWTHAKTYFKNGSFQNNIPLPIEGRPGSGPPL